MRRGVPEETSIGAADLHACAKEGQTKKNVRYNCTNTPSIQQDQADLGLGSEYKIGHLAYMSYISLAGC